MTRYGQTSRIWCVVLLLFVVVSCKPNGNHSRGAGNHDAEGNRTPIAATPLAGPPRNVLLITIDSLRWDHVGSYGYDKPTTPKLDAFGESAVRFQRAYAPSPWTLPSHASLLTGLYPDTHGVDQERSVLGPELPTLGEILQAHGYRTGAVVCAPFLWTFYGLQRGFDTYDTELMDLLPIKSLRRKVGPDVTKRGLDWIDQNRDQPFFLFLHYWDVHHDYNPPQEYVDLFDPGYEGDEDGLRIAEREHGELAPGYPKRDLKHLLALYDGEIRYTDDALGDLLAGLEQRGLMQNTLIWITSDHGEEFLDHGQVAHKKTCYEEVIRIPLIVRIPWMETASSVIDDAVSLLDFFPTALDALGIKTKRFLHQGLSLVPAIAKGKRLERRPLFAETATGVLPTGNKKVHWSAMLAPDGVKLHAIRPYGKRRGRLKFSMFDLRLDKEEANDVAVNRRQTANGMKRQFRYNKKTHRKIRKSLHVGEDTQKNLDKKLDETLKGLGYLQ
ncbi:MAG: sulfatase [Candidatus Lernaella stagnicola]|nr:sulfatase [Candidatus Lernaella stagnicola]